MKIFLTSLLGLFSLASCSNFEKSEEAIVLKIDTKSILKNRQIDSTIHIKNGNDVKEL